MDGDRVQVRPLRRAELRFAAGAHERYLPYGFFPSLGERFLRAYYRSFAESPHGVAFVAYLRGEPAGTIAGTLRNRAHYGWVVRHHGLRLAAWAALALLRRPSTAVYFLRTRVPRYARAVMRLALSRGRAGSDAHTSKATHSRQPAVLTHVAVIDAARGYGVGEQLVRRFAEQARQAGAGEIRLVTLADSRGAGGFYERLGWEAAGTRTDHDGREVAVYRLPLTAQGAPE